ALAFEHSLDRDSGPARDDLRDVIGGDRLLDERAACIRGFYHLQSFLELGNATIGKLAGALVFAAALRIGEFVARLVELGLELLGIRELVLLGPPSRGQRRRLLLEAGQLLLEPRQTLLGGGIRLLAQGFLLDLE